MPSFPSASCLPTLTGSTLAQAMLQLGGLGPASARGSSASAVSKAPS